jgi:long-subunit acyl-CoA synthetase (AMP-forming)
MEAVHETLSIEELLEEPTLCSAFLRAASANSDHLSLRDFASGESLTVGGWSARARLVAGGLQQLGVGHGDRVALLLSTRLEFHVVDIGAMLLGAAAFSLYVTSPVKQLAPCVDNALPKVLIAEEQLAEKARGLASVCPSIEHVVIIDGTGERELTLAQLEAICPAGFDVEETASNVAPDDLCSLLYTSGTSGPPKGVQYLHRALMTTMASIHERAPVSPGGRTIAYLPMAHIAERLFGHYAAFVFGYSVTPLNDPRRLGEALRAVRPTRFFGVPRIWEKLLAGIHRVIDGFEPERAAAVRAALENSVARVRAEQTGAEVPPELAASREADEALLAPLPEMIGLDRAEWACVAGAPAGRDTIEAFHAIGVRVNELYGMSETIMTSMSPPDRIRIGTSGLPLPGVELRLAEDGEILIGGPTVMPGYFQDPERTRAALDENGFMRSGDIGRIDEDGYLTIVDRKKAIIINSSGKNMSPAAIEQAIKGGVPVIAQVVVFGDRRPYNVALVVLDPEGVAAFCAAEGIPEAPFAVLTRDERVRAAIDDAVRRGNERLSRVEQIKRYEVLDHEWLPASDQLTATAKLRRATIEERYAGVVQALYDR